MIVAIASGKGGTGKTTVAVSLALAAAAQGLSVRLVDCDVEEPNAHLFLSPTIEEREEVGILTPVVDGKRCTYCGRCAGVCAYHALAVLPGQVLVFPELCHGCGSCALNCPESAIREKLRVTGIVEEGRANGLRFARGLMNVGEAMGVPIIRQLKRRLRQSDEATTLTVLDAPPGTSCPVVETLRGSDFALMVTEPTPFGLHDLRLAVEVARDELGLPVGVVLNRDGVGDGGVDAYCQAEGLPILLRIPLDRRIAEACSEGVPLIEALPEYRNQFVHLVQQITSEIQRRTPSQRPLLVVRPTRTG